ELLDAAVAVIGDVHVPGRRDGDTGRCFQRLAAGADERLQQDAFRAELLNLIVRRVWEVDVAGRIAGDLHRGDRFEEVCRPGDGEVREQRPRHTAVSLDFLAEPFDHIEVSLARIDRYAREDVLTAERLALPEGGGREDVPAPSKLREPVCRDDTRDVHVIARLIDRHAEGVLDRFPAEAPDL